MSMCAAARVIVVLLASACASAQDQLTVAVFNYTATPRAVIADAMDTSRRAFLSAGIDSRWVYCEPDRCRQSLPDNDSYMELHIMPVFRPTPAVAAEHPAGLAIKGLSHPRGYAFDDEAARVADRTSRPIQLVLSCILIHEAGHLLGLGHQSAGVMRATLEAGDMDNVTMGRAFQPVEIRRLRAAVRPLVTAAHR